MGARGVERVERGLDAVDGAQLAPGRRRRGARRSPSPKPSGSGPPSSSAARAQHVPAVAAHELRHRLLERSASTPSSASASLSARLDSSSESTSTPSQSKITSTRAYRTSQVVRRSPIPGRSGGLPVPNRVVLAPLAGIGNWFVRLQARRYGAGLVVSEMVSSFAIHYGNERTLRELLRIDPREREAGPGRSPSSCSATTPRSCARAAATVAEAGADLIDLNMGCPVPKVMKTGAGAALPRDPARAVAIARAAREGSGLPVTVKLRAEGVAGRARAGRGRRASPASPSTRATSRSATRGRRTTTSRRSWSPSSPVPVIVCGGMAGADHIRWVFEHTGCAAVMLARGAPRQPVAVRGGARARATTRRTPRRSSRSGCGCSTAPSSTSARSAPRAT